MGEAINHFQSTSCNQIFTIDTERQICKDKKSQKLEKIESVFNEVLFCDLFSSCSLVSCALDAKMVSAHLPVSADPLTA